MATIRRIGQGTVVQMSCQVTGTLAMAVCSVLLLRLYGDEAVGVFTLAKLAPSLAAMLAAFGIGTVCPYLIQRELWRPREIFGFMLLWTGSIGGLGALIWLTAATQMNQVLFQGKVTEWIVVLMSLALPIAMAEHFLVSLLQATKSMRLFAGATLCRTLIPATGGTIAALGWEGRLNAIALGTLLAMSITVLLLSLIVLARIGLPTNPFQHPKRIVKTIHVGSKSFVGSIALLANNRLDFVFISSFIGIGAAGIYGVVTKVAEFGRYFSIALNHYWMPHAASHSNEEAHRQTTRLVFIAWAGSGAISLGLLLISPWLLQIAGVPAGLPQTTLYVLFAGVIIQGGAGPVYAYCVAVGKPMRNSLAAMIALVATIALDLILIPKYNILGAAIASSCAYTIYTAALLWFFARSRGDKFYTASKQLKSARIAKKRGRSIIYMGGYGRSGSTLIEMLIADNSRVVGIGECSNIFEVFKNPGKAICSCGDKACDCPFWADIWKRINRRDLDTSKIEQWASLFESYYGFFFWIIAGKQRRQAYARYIRVFVSSVYRQLPEGIDYLVDSSKSTRKTALRPFWLQRFGGCRLVMVHVVRDARGCIWSQVRGSNKKLERNENPKLIFASSRTTVNWILSNCFANLIGSWLGNKQYTRVRYEDFITEPAETLASVERMSGLDLNDQYKRINTGLLSPNTHQFSGNRMRFSKFVKLRKDEEWRFRSRKHHRLISVFNWPLLMLYGYPIRAFQQTETSERLSAL